MSFRRRITTAVLGSALVLAAVLAVSSPASAAVGDGYGGQGQTDTQCQSSVARPQGYGFSAKIHVRQDYANQYTTAQVWVWDARGRWLPTAWFQPNNFPFMGYVDQGVEFYFISPEDLRPVDGHMVWIYVFYAWANPNGTWRTAGEFITRYTELSGYQRDYCEV